MLLTVVRCLNHRITWSEPQVWIGIPLNEHEILGFVFRTAPMFRMITQEHQLAASRHRPQNKQTNTAGLDWAKYKGAAHPPEKEPPYLAMDGLAVTTGRFF